MATVIGVDCATVDERTGIARAELSSSNRLDLLDARQCTAAQGALQVLAAWISDSGPNVTIALDAPLGWPVRLSPALVNHRAGEPLTVDAHSMFRRQTEKRIRALVKVPPFDVAADRIARTAYSALRLLGQLRATLGLLIPLAWSPDDKGVVHAIEVYPAATLKSHGWRYEGYKKKQQLSERREIINALENSRVTLNSFRPTLEASADALDAVVCLVAARDFIEGSAEAPKDAGIAAKEGWIWVHTSKPVA